MHPDLFKSMGYIFHAEKVKIYGEVNLKCFKHNSFSQARELDNRKDCMLCRGYYDKLFF